ncbi:glutaredoxin domain-containing protein [Micrococcus luteus]|uniref:glutaredoxin domain-containing protein n=1 Tax=Micrococcus luteus TaxID=1270 RepID=UPI0036725608
MTTTTTPAALWISAGGRITCIKHGGAALAAAVDAHPERLTHITTLDDWQAVTEGHRELWAAQVGADAAAEMTQCETCRTQAPTGEDRPMPETEAPAVVVYTRPACSACESTKRALDKRGIAYEVREMTDEDADRFRAEGHRQAPVVVTEGGTWAGFRPDRIVALPTP